MISATHKTEWQSRDRKKPVESAFTCYTNKRSRRLALVPLHARNEKHQGAASLAQVAIYFSTALEPLNFFMARRDLNNRGKVLHWFGGLARGGLESVITPRLKPGVAEADAVIGRGGDYRHRSNRSTPKLHEQLHAPPRHSILGVDGKKGEHELFVCESRNWGVNDGWN